MGRFKKYAPLLSGCAMLACVLWLIVFAAETTGAMGIGWEAVLLTMLWIPCVMALGCGIAFAMLAASVWIERKVRKRKVMRRIRAQAIRCGIWDYPPALGGKALEMSARENFGIRKKPGESNADLRLRCMARRAQMKRGGRHE